MCRFAEVIFFLRKLCTIQTCGFCNEEALAGKCGSRRQPAGVIRPILVLALQRLPLAHRLESSQMFAGGSRLSPCTSTRSWSQRSHPLPPSPKDLFWPQTCGRFASCLGQGARAEWCWGPGRALAGPWHRSLPARGQGAVRGSRPLSEATLLSLHNPLLPSAKNRWPRS